MKLIQFLKHQPNPRVMPVWLFMICFLPSIIAAIVAAIIKEPRFLFAGSLTMLVIYMLLKIHYLEKQVCDDCGCEIGKDDGPSDGWQLEDGRTVCHHCCADDTKRLKT